MKRFFALIIALGLCAAFAMAGIFDLRLHSFGSVELATRLPMSLQAGLGRDLINFLILCVVYFLVGYLVAYFMIGKFRYATPGRLGNYMDENGEDFTVAGESRPEGGGDDTPEKIIALLGGRENIVLVDSCMTRLRVTVKDPALVAELDAWRGTGALGLVKKGTGIQAVYGPRADVLKSDVNDLL